MKIVQTLPNYTQNLQHLVYKQCAQLCNTCTQLYTPLFLTKVYNMLQNKNYSTNYKQNSPHLYNTFAQHYKQLLQLYTFHKTVQKKLDNFNTTLLVFAKALHNITQLQQTHKLYKAFYKHFFTNKHSFLHTKCTAIRHKSRQLVHSSTQLYTTIQNYSNF